jgi:glutamine---fructose-6-phosphate transaminase (isomerizing)
MTHFLDDILRQPSALASTVKFLGAAGNRQLKDAAALLQNTDHIYLTGIGSSYCAALAAAPFFSEAAYPVFLQDAAELLHFAAFAARSAVVVISRSGQSVEIVNLLAKARECGTSVIGLTNSESSPLAQQAQIPLVVPVDFDHAISVNTYSTLAATASALAAATVSSFNSDTQTALLQAIDETSRAIEGWRKLIADATWFAPESAYYFLARGSSLASCHEARLLWEEGAKHPATSMGTGSFRHGPQEVVTQGSRFGVWVDPQRMREEDIAVARDLGTLGSSVMLIGHELPEDVADLILRTPAAPPGWQFLFDIFPAQLAAEHLARISGVDCDKFRVCSYVVEEEHGLLGKKTDVFRTSDSRNSDRPYASSGVSKFQSPQPTRNSPDL